MDQYSREFIAEKARLRPEDLGLVRTARRSHNQLGLAYQIAFIRLLGGKSIDYPQANDVTFKKAPRVRPNPSEKQKILPIMEGEPPEDRNEG